MTVICEHISPSVWQARVEPEHGDLPIDQTMGPSEKQTLIMLQHKLERAAEAVRETIADFKE